MTGGRGQESISGVGVVTHMRQEAGGRQGCQGVEAGCGGSVQVVRTPYYDNKQKIIMYLVF